MTGCASGGPAHAQWRHASERQSRRRQPAYLLSLSIDSPAQRPDLVMSVYPSDPPPSDSGKSSGTSALAAEIAKHMVVALQSRGSPSTSTGKFYVLHRTVSTYVGVIKLKATARQARVWLGAGKVHKETLPSFPPQQAVPICKLLRK